MERFGTRVYNVGFVAFDVPTLKACRRSLLRMIKREDYQIEKEVDAAIISDRRDRVHRLRVIRRDLKRVEKLL